MGNTARVHLLFRGAAEVTKKLRKIALISELAAAAISLYVILVRPNDTAAWLPLAILTLVLIGTVLRVYSSSAQGFARRCHRISLRAFCEGKDVDVCTAALLEDDAPPGVDWLAAKLPVKSLEEYYEPTTPPGPARQAELYAHSAFYTWRLLRLQAWILFGGALFVLIVSAGVIYYFAGHPQSANREAILEAICTVILLVLSVRGFEAAWYAYTSYSEIRSIENAILRKPGDEVLEDLADSYDIERASGANPMTFLYAIQRDSLSCKWHERRKNFVDLATQFSGPPTGDH